MKFISYGRSPVLWFSQPQKAHDEIFVHSVMGFLWFFTLFCEIKIITYKIGIEKEHYLLQNVSCLKLRTEVE